MPRVGVPRVGMPGMGTVPACVSVCMSVCMSVSVSVIRVVGLQWQHPVLELILASSIGYPPMKYL